MMKLVLMRTATGIEDPELPLLPRISSLELPASEIALILCNRGISRSSFPVVVLMRASFIIVLDGFCDCT